MGGELSCPAGFERGQSFLCRATCPDRFKYVQETSTTGPIREYCASMYNNAVRATLKSLPPPRPGLEPPAYAAERTRLKGEFDALRAQVASQQLAYDALMDVRGQMAANAQAYSQIRTEYARYAEHYENSPATVKGLVDTLKPLRPPTAPAEDLAAERKAILESSAPNFLLIQVELAIVILCLLTYVFLDVEYAPGVTVFLLSVGVALGIFLWK